MSVGYEVVGDELALGDLLELAIDKKLRDLFCWGCRGSGELDRDHSWACTPEWTPHIC